MQAAWPDARGITRREVMEGIAIVGVTMLTGGVFGEAAMERKPMAVTCIIRYQIDPYQREAFKKYAENWGRIIPRCGGYLVGYFLPYEGTNDVAWGLIGFDSLASYERYRTRLKADAEARENLAMAQSMRLILREERNFVETVEGTLGLRSTFSEENVSPKASK